jgi:hypothetical protein
VFLVNNAVFRAKKEGAQSSVRTASTASTANATNAANAANAANAVDRVRASAGTLRFRDPVTVATSSNGYVFDTAAAVMSW